MGNTWLTQTSPTISTSIIAGTSTISLFDTVATTGTLFNAAATATLGYTGTDNSTTNFATGVNASGKTKNIYIGGGGASGSTTNISIGSSTSGSTNNISLNGLINGYLSTPPSISGLNGTWFGWNSAGLGESIFANFRQGGTGGFDFRVYANDGSLISTPLQIKESSVNITVAGLNFTNATAAAISFGVGGANTPTFTTRSTGTKAVYYQTLSGSLVDYARGIAASTLWDSIPEATSGYSYKLFGGTTQIFQIKGDGAASLAGSFSASGTIISDNLTGGIGYSSSVSVTQATNKSTAVTCDSLKGTITMNNAALASGGVIYFTVTNSKVVTGDVPVASSRGGFSGNYRVVAMSAITGSFIISVTNTDSVSRSEAVIIDFRVFK